MHFQRNKQSIPIEHHIQADKVEHHVKTNEHVHKSMYIDIYNKQI